MKPENKLVVAMLILLAVLSVAVLVKEKLDLHLLPEVHAHK